MNTSLLTDKCRVKVGTVTPIDSFISTIVIIGRNKVVIIVRKVDTK